MAITAWLDLIRQKFSPEDGQILVRSLHLDPLVWQFIQDETTSLPYFQTAPNNLDAYAPGKIAAWLIEKSADISLGELGRSDFSLPGQLKAHAVQAFETTLNTSLPPADLQTAGLLALTLRERHQRKGTWQGISEEIFIHRNQESILKNYHIWRTPFACLFNFCPDFDDLCSDFANASANTVNKSFLPIFLHTIIANPMIISQQLEKLFNFVKNLSIDLQLESLGWLKSFRHEHTQIQLAKHLIQTKNNRDFFAGVFSELERFAAASPEIDPLQKTVPFSLPEDVNRLAAFYAFTGNEQKAIENRQKAGDLLEFLKAQTLFQNLVSEPGQGSPSRWLEIIQSVPHSKQARLFYAQALIADQRFEEAQNQLKELPQSAEQQLLLSQLNEHTHGQVITVSDGKIKDHKALEFKPKSSYFINPFNFNLNAELFDVISQDLSSVESIAWVEEYLRSNPNDLDAVKKARHLYERTDQIDKSIELTAYLERLEPEDTRHKRNLARLLSRAEHWEEAFDFIQSLVKSDDQPAIKDLEIFAEAALRTHQTEMAMSICQNILRVDADNTKALVLLGEIYLHKGDVVKAIQHMEDVVEQIPDEPEAWLTLAWLWSQKDQTDRAIETLMKGIQRIPDQPLLLRALGKARLDQRDLPEALMAYKQAYAIDPEHLNGKIDLASIYFQLEQPENAYPLLVDFLDNYQIYPNIARLLGHVLVSLDQTAKAEPILLFAAEQFPDDVNTVLSATRLVLERIESDPEAEKQTILEDIQSILNAAGQIYPNNAEISLHLADLDRLNGLHQKAFDTYRRLASDPTQTKSLYEWRLKYGFGQAALATGNQEVGLAALQEALGLQPGNLMVRHALAEALFSAELPGKANAMAKSALRMAPQSLSNILWYANFKTKSNEPEEAVRALKEALQITPQRTELRLWLVKSLISAGSVEEAHQNIATFISAAPKNPILLQQAGYVCIHLNDLDMAAQALEKAIQASQGDNYTYLLDLAIIYSLQDQHKQALDVLDVDQNLINLYPQIAILKADLLSKIGQFDLAFKSLQSIADSVEGTLDINTTKDLTSATPLIYAHDMTIYGYHFRLGQLSRAMGQFEDAQVHFSWCLDENPEDIVARNASLENAMVGLNHQLALELIDEIDLSSLAEERASHDLLDLVCSQAEILMYQDNFAQAETLINGYASISKAYPRFLAIESRLTAKSGRMEHSRDQLNNALSSFNETLGNHQPQNPTETFRKMINLHSIAEACISLGDHLDAIQAWARSYHELETQPLLNWRYLYALVIGAEAQQIARTLAITSYCPGEMCLSEEHHKMAETLLQGLQNMLPQDQIVCLKARIESAFTGNWPLHLNIDSCLQGPEEAAAGLIGSQDKNLVREILETYPEDIQVLQAYGIYALRHHLQDAIPYVEKAASIEPANPINHALMAQLTREQPELAVKSIETALSLWPNESEWHALAAEFYTSLGNKEIAEKHIQCALEIQPENAGFWEKSALIKVEKNAFLDAKYDLEKSTTYQPDNPKTWAVLSEVNRRMGDVSDALINIRKASQLDPDDLHLANQEMQILCDQKNFVELESKAKAIIAQDYANDSAQIFLAQALAKQGKFEQALTTLKQAISVAPDNANLVLELMKIKKDQVGIEQVIPELVALAQKYPEHPTILIELTDWLIQTNRIDEAEKAAQTTLRLLPEQAEVYIMLGRLQRARGKLDQAIAHLSQAITLDPMQIEAYIELGKTYQDRRDVDRAIATFEQATQANTSDPRPYYYAGLALKDVKDYSGAEVMLKQAKRYSPDDANIIRQLGVVTALNLVNNLREA